jgi:hypothetical protein
VVPRNTDSDHHPVGAVLALIKPGEANMQTSVTSTEAAAIAGAASVSSPSAVSWAAVIAGAFVAAALTLILLLLGAGFGLAVASPWSSGGPSATGLGVGAAIWLVVVEWIAFGLGGYVAGRLRTKWVGLHTDEVFFRDTAHGLLVWALATVVGAVLLTSAVSSLVSGGTRAATSVLSGAAQGATQAAGQNGGIDAYLVDDLFRAGPSATAAPSAQDARGEATRILARSLSSGTLAPDDKSYLADLIATRTGLAKADAEKRIDTVVATVKDTAAKAKDAAEKARKAAASAALITFVSLLVGAFIACVAGALGGRRRDEY